MTLSTIVVALFLNGSLQIGLVDGYDFQGKSRADFKDDAQSVSMLEEWVRKNTNDSKSLSYCVVIPNDDYDGPLEDHLMQQLIDRQENGYFDIYSSHRNVLASLSKSKVKEVNFFTAAGNCRVSIDVSKPQE